MKDLISQQRLALLHPKVQDSFRHFIDEAESSLGITLRIVQGLRTIEEQNALYAQGRTKPGKIVTNAIGGSSFHNYGLAIDVAQLDGGKINWGFDYKKLLPIAEKYGLSWGGNWKTKDLPHFQKSAGFTWQQLKKKVESKDFIPGTQYVNI